MLFSNRHKSYNCPYFWIKISSKVIWERSDVFWKEFEKIKKISLPELVEELHLEEKSKVRDSVDMRDNYPECPTNTFFVRVDRWMVGHR